MSDLNRIGSILCAAVHLASEMTGVHIEGERSNHKNSKEWLEQYSDMVDVVTDRYSIGDEIDEAVMKDIADNLLTFAARIAEAR